VRWPLTQALKPCSSSSNNKNIGGGVDVARISGRNGQDKGRMEKDIKMSRELEDKEFKVL
jgi:hypothetical protein